MEHLRGVSSDAYTTHSSLILETYILRDKIEKQFSKALYFFGTNSLEVSIVLLKKISNCA